MHERYAMTAILTLALLVSLTACATSPPKRPPARAVTSIEKVYPEDFDVLWEVTRATLKVDPRLALDTIDRAGRFVAKERSSGFIFFQVRTVLQIEIERVPDGRSLLALRATAEKYDLGGLSRRAGWYPSDKVNEELAREIVEEIEAQLVEL